MKFFILLLAAVAFAHAEFTKEEDDRWLQYKLQHGKLFLSPGKEKARKETFLETAREIDEHNEKFLRGEVTYSQAINKYSDMPEDVFMERMAGTVMPAEVRSENQRATVTLRQKPPASVDLRANPAVKNIRDQNPCGSCWAFSTCAAAEYAYWLLTNRVLDVSEQQLVDCTYPASTDGCRGGWIPEAFDYIAKAGGVVLEHSYPYTKPKESGVCKTPDVYKFVRLAKPSYKQINADVNSIKNALNTFGVLSVCVDATQWRRDIKGVFESPNCGGTLKCNHAVALVGYGSDNGVDYWIIKNSWGPDFSEGGFIRLAARILGNGNVAGGLFLNSAYAPIIQPE